MGSLTFSGPLERVSGRFGYPGLGYLERENTEVNAGLVFFDARFDGIVEDSLYRDENP
jgi:hypothetical protein